MKRFLVILLAFALLLGGCGGSDPVDPAVDPSVDPNAEPSGEETPVLDAITDDMEPEALKEAIFDAIKGYWRRDDSHNWYYSFLGSGDNTRYTLDIWSAYSPLEAVKVTCIDPMGDHTYMFVCYYPSDGREHDEFILDLSGLAEGGNGKLVLTWAFTEGLEPETLTYIGSSLSKAQEAHWTYDGVTAADKEWAETLESMLGTLTAYAAAKELGVENRSAEEDFWYTLALAVNCYNPGRITSGSKVAVAADDVYDLAKSVCHDYMYYNDAIPAPIDTYVSYDSAADEYLFNQQGYGVCSAELKFWSKNVDGLPDLEFGYIITSDYAAIPTEYGSSVCATCSLTPYTDGASHIIPYYISYISTIGD